MSHALERKNALVTGGSRGIGRAVAIQMALQGARVVIAYLKNEARANEVVTTILDAGGQASAIRAELSRVSEVIRLLKRKPQL